MLDDSSQSEQMLDPISNHDQRRIFAKKLRKRRTQLGVTQMWLAEKAHVSFQQINNLEHGRCYPSLDVYLALCRALAYRRVPFLL